MKVFIYILLIIAVGLLIFNATKLDIENLFQGESMTAAITVMAAACTILLLVILLLAKKISKKV